MSEPGVGTCEDALGTPSSVLSSGSCKDARGTSSRQVVGCSVVVVIFVWLEIVGSSFGACITATCATASHVVHAGSTNGGGSDGGRAGGSSCGGGGSGGGRG